MRRFAYLMSAWTLMLAAACGPAATPVPTTAPAAPAAATAPTTAPAAAAPTTAAAKPAAGGRGQGGLLKILYWQAPTILNTHLAQGTKDYDAGRLVLEPLASFGPDGEPVANLAAEIPTIANGGVSKDLKTVTWKLKQGVKWSDGTDFTSDDVIFTWQYVADPKTASSDNNTAVGVESVTAPDKFTAIVNYKEPNPNSYQIFVSGYGNIIQKKQFQDFIGEKSKDAPGNLNPVGT